MAMRDYIAINNHAGLGRIGISRHAIASIAATSLREIGGVSIYHHGKRRGREGTLGSLFSLASGVHVVFTKDGKASIKMDVSLAKGANVPTVCEKIQETVATAITLMCDMVPFEVQVKVMRLG